MENLSIELNWVLGNGELNYDKYSTDHKIKINDEIKILKENETIFIPKGSRHRLANEVNTKLIIIEFWYGDILDENDIERFEDIYERI